MRKKGLLITLGLIVAVGAWYAFRPERLFINQKVSEGFPAVSQAATMPAQPVALATGRFHNAFHDGQGLATVYQLPDGKRVLRLTEFETSNGPDLQLYLVAAEDPKDDAAVKTAGFVTLGALKGNQGDQNYDIPSGVDLAKYRSVTVWCRRFSKNFATAPLALAQMSGEESMAAMQQPTALFSGRFHNGLHDGKGLATVYQLSDGKRVLRLTEFETSNGPDLQLYLVAAGDAKDSETVKTAGFVTLGALKGNQGDQNYDIPSNVDLAKYRAVTVWCRRFSVNFTTAPLVQQ
jgi:outer membrane protease